MHRLKSLSNTVILLLALTCSSAQSAENANTADSTASNATSNAASNATSNGAEPSSTLKGGVVTVEVTLNDLRDARLSASRMRKAAANLYDEVSRQEMTMIMNPNVVGSMVIMTPQPSFTGQYMKPRKKWVDEAMDDIGPTIKLFKEDVDTAIETNRRTDVSGSVQTAINAIREDVFSLVKSSFETYKTLEGLTAVQGDNYDNKAIATASKSLDNDMKKLDKALKKGIDILQKEAKKAKKEKAA